MQNEDNCLYVISKDENSVLIVKNSIFNKKEHNPINYIASVDQRIICDNNEFDGRKDWLKNDVKFESSN